MTGPVARNGMRRSSSWTSLLSGTQNATPISLSQLVSSRDVTRGANSRNNSRNYSRNISRNATQDINNSRSSVNTRCPKHTLPIRTVVRIIDPIKIRYIEQQERSINKENSTYQRPQSADIQIRPRRDPSPTPPLRVLHASRENIAPEKVTTHRSSSSHRIRPVRFQLNADPVAPVNKVPERDNGSYAKKLTEQLRTQQETKKQSVPTNVQNPKPDVVTVEKHKKPALPSNFEQTIPLV
jgi:hypothetical protein